MRAPAFADQLRAKPPLRPLKLPAEAPRLDALGVIGRYEHLCQDQLGPFGHPTDSFRWLKG